MGAIFQGIILPLFTAVGTIVVGGGVITTFAFWLFKLFGEHWLSNRFAERLAAFQREQAKELERLKFDISKLLDRTAKLHQREFEVVPKAWNFLARSYYSTQAAVSSVQTYPDLRVMGSAQFDEFLSNSLLQNWQKAELRAATDKNEYYQNAINRCRLSDAKAAERKSALYLLRNGIFMPVDMKTKFDQIDVLIWSALREHQMNIEYDIKEEKERTKFA